MAELFYFLSHKLNSKEVILLNLLRKRMNSKKMLKGMSPIGLLAVGGLLALSLNPRAKKAAQRAAKSADKGARKALNVSSSVLDDVRKNMRKMINNADIRSEIANFTSPMNKVRVRKRGLFMGMKK